MTSRSDSRSEITVSMAVDNPNSSGTSRSFRYAGKIDLVSDGIITDWKFVSDPQQYLMTRTIGFQQELYAIAYESCYCETIRSIRYRLIQKPTIKLCGKDTSPEAYEKRCVDWLMTTPGAIQEHEIDINPARYRAAKQWLWNVTQRILQCRREDCWLTNENACKLWQRECEFLPLCMCEVNGGDVGWLINNRYENRPKHEELDDVPDDKDTITYSSGTTFTACERKYYWQYYMAIRKQRDETSDALYTGSAGHVGMEWLVREGLESALAHITQWALDHDVIGPNAASKQAQAIARARAGVRVAAEKWMEDGRNE